MKFSYMGGATVRLAWLLLLIGTVLLCSTTPALGMTAPDLPGLDLPRTTGEQVALVVLVLVILLLCTTPFFIAHELRRHELVLRQGVLLRAAIPFADVEAVGDGAAPALYTVTSTVTCLYGR